MQWRDSKGKPLFDYHHDLYQLDSTDLNDFDEIFNRISADISNSLRNTFLLKNTYDLNTTKVILTKDDDSTMELSPNVYTITDKTLVIDPEQLVKGAQVRIQR